MLCKEESSRALEVLLPLTSDVVFTERGRRRFHPSWMYCQIQNCTSEPIFVYGPRHPSVGSSLPTSLFILPGGQTTPSRWDCKGLLIPADRIAMKGRALIVGPAPLKYRDMRRVQIRMENGMYLCPRSNGLLPSGHVEFAAPAYSYAALLALPRQSVVV